MIDNSGKAVRAAIALFAMFSSVAGSPARADDTKKPNAASEDGITAEDREAGSLAIEGYTNAIRQFETSQNGQEAARAVDTVNLWSRRIVEAEDDPFDAFRLRSAAKGHLDRMKFLVESAQKKVGTDSDTTALCVLNARYYRAEAERLLKAAEAQVHKAHIKALNHANEVQVSAQGNATASNPLAPGSRDDLASIQPVKDARTVAVLKALDQPLAMDFGKETPLEDVLKYVKEKTRSTDLPAGVPIYIDPVGLQEAEKTVSSPVMINLEGVPLRRTLQLVLKQLGLVYQVDDGLIAITCENSDGPVGLAPAIQEPPPLMILQRRAERGELSVSERKAFLEMLKDLREIQRLTKSEAVANGIENRGMP